MALIEIQDVCKGFGSGTARREVLRGVNLSIEEGEFVAIVGCSGSGKTTLVNLIAGLLAPDRGTVRVAGRSVTGPGADRGLVFQNYSLLPWLTVFENVLLAVDQVFGDWTPAQRREHAGKYIEMVHLGAARDQRPVALSGGMRQRASLARTLAARPKVLLLDEPLGALDALTRSQLQDEISGLCREQGATALLITNDPDEAILLADRVIPMTRGPGASLAGSTPVTLARPRDRRFLNTDEEFKRIRAVVFAAMRAAAAPAAAPASAAAVTLPDILPCDLVGPKPRFGAPGPARRRAARSQTDTPAASAAASNPPRP